MCRSVGLVGLVAVTPSTSTPVGVGVTEGESMGDSEPQVTVYADLEPEVGDTIVFEPHFRATNGLYIESPRILTKATLRRAMRTRTRPITRDGDRSRDQRKYGEGGRCDVSALESARCVG